MLHHPFEFLERTKVVSHAIVVDDPPIFKLIRGEDGVVALVEQFRPVNGLPLSPVSFAFLPDHLLWNFEADISIDAPASLSVAIEGVFGIALVRGDAHSLRIWQRCPAYG